MREDGHDRTVEHITGWEGGNRVREAPKVRCRVPGREEGGAGPAACAQGRRPPSGVAPDPRLEGSARASEAQGEASAERLVGSTFTHLRGSRTACTVSPQNEGRMDLTRGRSSEEKALPLLFCQPSRSPASLPALSLYQVDCLLRLLP